ncbi:hypothetical protein PoB_000877600, partial [Plakobranchus ocellatus]
APYSTFGTPTHTLSFTEVLTTLRASGQEISCASRSKMKRVWFWASPSCAIRKRSSTSQLLTRTSPRRSLSTVASASRT